MMIAQEFVLRRRTEVLHALCCSGSSESLESVLDILLSQEQLTWEEYQSVHVPGRSLHTNARELLDLVYTKGVDTCMHFLSGLKLVLPNALNYSQNISIENRKQENATTCIHTLVTQRPSLVNELKDYINELLDVLTASGQFTLADCEEVKLPIRTPSQQARSLLDHVQAKGEPAAVVVLQYAQQKQQLQCSSPLNEHERSFPKEFYRYHKKLNSSVLAQSYFVSTYGGTSHMSLDDIYTEGQLELPQDCADAGVSLSLEDIIGAVGTVNMEADTILVSGDAGSGKSTLLQRMHLLWAQGAALQDFLLLFPFSCRRLNSEQKELCIMDLLFQHCCWPDRDQAEIFQFILDHPQLILFTFDGLDELKQPFSDEHRICCPTQCAPVPILLFNLLQGCLLKGVRKIVTSRPEAVSPALKKHIHKEVILKGFSLGGIDCFVRKHHNDPVVAAKVLGSLQANTALLGLCHSPVLCWIVSQCHKELLDYKEESPKTITHVYLMILQHFFQHQSSSNNIVGSSWIQDQHTTVLRLGQLAFEGIKSSIYVFSHIELNKCGVTEKDIGSGFLVRSNSMSSNHCKTFEFLHVTMQCFFAALFVVLSTSEHYTIPKLFKTHTKDTKLDHHGTTCLCDCMAFTAQQQHVLDRDTLEAKHKNLQITATFVCGVLSQRHHHLLLQCCPSGIIGKRVRQVAKCLSKGLQKHFRSIPQPIQGEKKSMHAMPEFVWLIKCIYEMQESTVAKEAMSKLDVEHLKLTYCNIGPIECTALAYVLQHLKNPVGLQLDYNSTGDVGVEQLLPCLHICNSLYLRNNNISDEGICKLIAKAIDCEHFQKIALFNNKLTDSCMKNFSELLKAKQNFCSLRLGNNNITAEGAQQLAEGLKSHDSLRYLGLWGNKIGDVGAKAFASALENSKTLVWLSLVGNGVGSAGACSLANVIRKCTSLEELWLTDNCITRPGVECLIEALQHNTHVKSVWLRNNDLSAKDKEEMAQCEPRLVF